jgi:hypothetical protein
MTLHISKKVTLHNKMNGNLHVETKGGVAQENRSSASLALSRGITAICGTDTSWRAHTIKGQHNNMLKFHQIKSHLE